MAINHRTARGIPVDIDRLRLANEQTIAVGNMRVNARGDQLGAGGKVIKTRQEIMMEKNKLHHGPIADEFDVIADTVPVVDDYVIPETQNLQPVAEETPVAESTEAGYVKPRGSFAESVAQQTEITQELLDPSVILGTKPTGVQRI